MRHSTESKRIGIVSTYFENIGDDLIRDGTLQLLKNVFGEELSFHHISKANPLSDYFPISWLSHGPTHRMPKLLSHLIFLADRALQSVRYSSLVEKCSIVAFAGAPQFYNLTYGTFLQLEPWIGHLWHRHLTSRRQLFLPIGLGSILEESPEAFVKNFPAEREFIAQFIDRSVLVTARDTKTYHLLKRCQRPGSHTLLWKGLCPSLWAAEAFRIQRNDQNSGEHRQVAAVSFTTESIRWDSRADEARARREAAFDIVVSELKQAGFLIQPIVHNEYDLPIALRMSRERELLAPLQASSRGLLEQLSRSALIISWRVHGAIGAFSLGVPALLFKTDSRFQMAEDYGISLLDDREDPPDVIRRAVRDFIASSSSFSGRDVTSLKQREEERLRRVLCVQTIAQRAAHG